MNENPSKLTPNIKNIPSMHPRAIVDLAPGDKKSKNSHQHIMYGVIILTVVGSPCGKKLGNTDTTVTAT